MGRFYIKILKLFGKKIVVADTPYPQPYTPNQSGQ